MVSRSVASNLSKSFVKDVINCQKNGSGGVGGGEDDIDDDNDDEENDYGQVNIQLPESIEHDATIEFCNFLFNLAAGEHQLMGFGR